MVRGKVAPRIFNDKELEPRITSIMQLSEAQDILIKEMTLNMPVQEITAEVIEDLAGIIKGSEGKISFRVRVTDPENDVSLGFMSRAYKINLSAELINFCEDGGYRYSLM